MKLISLPDCKINMFLTLGKEYAVTLWGFNGYAITTDSGDRAVLLRERFE